MTNRLNKTSICSVVFLDIIGYSNRSISEQIDEKTLFNKLLADAVKSIATSERIILDTGDGAAISFMGEPEEALFVSLSIRNAILVHNKIGHEPLMVRIGINLGSVRVVNDINGRLNVLGDAINVAQRIMSFAEPNQILVSRSYYEVASRLTKDLTNMFSYFGIKQDKHVREHEVYQIKASIDEMYAKDGLKHGDVVNNAWTKLDETDKVAAHYADTIKSSAYAQAIKFQNLWPVLPVLLAALMFTVYSQATKIEKTELPMTAPSRQASISDLSVEKITQRQNAVAVESTELNAPVTEVKSDKLPRSATKKAVKKSAPREKAEDKNNVSQQQIKSANADKTMQKTQSVNQESSWGKFKASVKQGRENKCSQAQIAMGQCN